MLLPNLEKIDQLIEKLNLQDIAFPDYLKQLLVFTG